MTNTITEIKNNWLLIIFIGSLIVGWTTFNNRLGAVEVKADTNTTTLKTLQRMQVDIATMKVDINYIKIRIK